MHKEALKIVFSNPVYLAIVGLIFAPIFVLLLHTRELLFFEPYFVFHLPEDSILSFALIIVLSGLMGVVISMTIFRLRNFKSDAKKMGTGIMGSIVGVGAGVCTTCGPIGFAIISTVGIAGATTLSFLTFYEIPIRLGAIGILSVTYFLMAKGITSECKVDMKKI